MVDWFKVNKWVALLMVVIYWTFGTTFIAMKDYPNGFVTVFHVLLNSFLLYFILKYGFELFKKRDNHAN